MRPRKRSTPDVAITHNTNESLAIYEALNQLQAEALITPDDIVVITPNWVQQKVPATGTVVGTESLREVISFVKSRNPRRIVIATGSGERDTSEIMNKVGFSKIIQEEQVEFIDLNKGPFKRINLNHSSPTATNVNTLLDEMTVLISFTQLKCHEEATLSAAIKNIALAWPPAEEHGHPKKNLGIHSDLHGFIRAMAEQIPIDLSIVSANPVMIGTGPGKGIPRHTGLVIAGTDPVAVDTVGARLLGFKPQAIGYLYDAVNKQIGIGDVSSIHYKGISLVEAEKLFSQAVYGEACSVDS